MKYNATTPVNENNATFDLIGLAIRYLTEETKNQLIRSALEKQVMDVIARSGSQPPYDVLMNIGSKLQSRMAPEMAQDFSQHVYEATQIDCRSVRRVRGKALRNLGEIVQIIDQYQHQDAYSSKKVF